MLVKMNIRVVTIMLTMMLWLIVEISIFSYSFEFFKRIIKKDFYKCSVFKWFKLTINVILAISQIVFLIIWAWT